MSDEVGVHILVGLGLSVINHYTKFYLRPRVMMIIFILNTSRQADCVPGSIYRKLLVLARPLKYQFKIFSRPGVASP